MKAIHIIGICLFTGCSPTRVEPLALLEGQNTVIILRRDVNLTKNKEVIAVDDLSRILARATWIDHTPFHKGGNWIQFSGGKEVFIPYVLDIVMVRGTKGHFLIRSEDRKRFYAIAQRIHTQANKPHHPTASSRSVDMISCNYNIKPVIDFRPRS